MVEEYCEKHGGLGVNQFELDGCPGCLWEGIKEELKTSRKASVNLLKSLSKAEMQIMWDYEFRCFLDLMMCSDPWPVDDLEINSHRILNDFADRISRERGFADWIAAYHQFEVI